jgi:hypothetical protein
VRNVSRLTKASIVLIGGKLGVGQSTVNPALPAASESPDFAHQDPHRLHTANGSVV